MGYLEPCVVHERQIRSVHPRGVHNEDMIQGQEAWSRSVVSNGVVGLHTRLVNYVEMLSYVFRAR